MEFRDYLRVLRRSARLIVVLVVLGALVGAGFAALQPERYTASARAFVSVPSAQTLSDQISGVSFAEQAAKGYADIATSAFVLQPVIDRLGLPNTPAGLSRRLTVTVADSSPVVTVTVVDATPTRAARTANAVITQLSTAAAALTPGTGTAASSAVKLTAVDLASGSLRAGVGIKPWTAGVIGALIGAVLAIAVGLFRELLDTRIRTRDDLERVTEAPLLGTTARDPRTAREPLVVKPGGDFRAEAYRSIRTSLRFVDLAGDRRSLAVTSSLDGEGKSVTVSNLALALGDLGTKVLLVDADLRRPRIADYFGVEGAVGLTDVLIGEVRLEDAIQAFGSTGVDLLTAGTLPPNPNEQLQSPAMRRLLEQLHAEYDIVLFDTPPVLAVSDALVLAEQVGGTVVVAASGRVRRPQLEQALADLDRSGARVAGLVLTMLPREGRADQRYGYGHRADQPAVAAPETVPAAGADQQAPCDSEPAETVGRHAVDERPRPESAAEAPDPAEDETAPDAGPTDRPRTSDVQPVDVDVAVDDDEPSSSQDAAAAVPPEHDGRTGQALRRRPSPRPPMRIAPPPDLAKRIEQARGPR